MIGRVMSETTLRGLMRRYQDEIPSLFGFEHMVIVFHDPEQKVLYSIAMGDVEE